MRTPKDLVLKWHNILILFREGQDTITRLHGYISKMKNEAWGVCK